MSLIFENVERFVAGTVGEPGARAFYIQVRSGRRLATIALEKLQVAALAEQLQVIIKDLVKRDLTLRIAPSSRDDAPLELPIESEFIAGSISMAWDETDLLLTIDFFEIEREELELPLSLSVKLTLQLCDAFIKRSNALVGAGRLPCPFCGLPIDSGGHLCPRANGYRR